MAKDKEDKDSLKIDKLRIALSNKATLESDKRAVEQFFDMRHSLIDNNSLTYKSILEEIIASPRLSRLIKELKADQQSRSRIINSQETEDCPPLDRARLFPMLSKYFIGPGSALEELEIGLFSYATTIIEELKKTTKSVAHSEINLEGDGATLATLTDPLLEGRLSAKRIADLDRACGERIDQAREREVVSVEGGKRKPASEVSLLGC